MQEIHKGTQQPCTAKTLSVSEVLQRETEENVFLRVYNIHFQGFLKQNDLKPRTVNAHYSLDKSSHVWDDYILQALSAINYQQEMVSLIITKDKMIENFNQ